MLSFEKAKYISFSMCALPGVIDCPQYRVMTILVAGLICSVADAFAGSAQATYAININLIALILSRPIMLFLFVCG